MKKVVICNIPMKKNEMRYIYKSDDLSLITSDKAVFYPINAFLEKHLEKSDEVKVILLVKRDLQNASSQNVSDFIDEIMSVNSVGANIVYKEKARKMIKNYVIGLVVIFAILVACPHLVKGIAALIAG